MATITDTENPSFKLAADFVNYTQASIFLTGKAGTGKTTFLKHCKENEKKNTAIVAPTGVAAINAGGTTIHSFFQLPFTPYIPEGRGFGNSETVTDRNSLIAKLRLTNDRRDVMQQLELLIIDEISMVRCDVLDAIDIVLRHVRNRHSQPFGGVQVLLIGDMFQLPPVAKEEEWQLLSPYYKSPYFFNSQVIESQPPVYVELNKIYRQRDEGFVDLLNKVRNNAMDKPAFDLLHSRYLPHFNPAKEENYITLTTHNNKADAINNKALNELNGAVKIYKATIKGDFNEKAYPADVELRLKMGAQVMFIKNDVEKVRRYFNGRIGVVTRLDDDKIFVLCKGDTTPIEVKLESWKNIRYAVDKTTNHIEENELGSFSQFPLRLAWAITIHKSQGLTFEKAIIDAGDAFAPGQVYVALSRCTSLQGLVLHSHIQNSSLHSDERIGAFSRLQKTSAEQLQLLHEAKCYFQQQEIIKLFDFTGLQKEVQQIIPLISVQLPAFNKEALPWVLDMEKMIDNLQVVSNKFSPQLHQLLQTNSLPEQNEVLQKRLIAAAKHFCGAMQLLTESLQRCPVVTDGKLLAADFNKAVNDLLKKVHAHCHQMQALQDGFFIDQFLKHKRTFVKPSNTVNIYAGKASGSYSDSPHPALHQQLRKLRDLVCDETGLPVYRVAASKTLDELVTFLPQTYQELSQISGFGSVRIKQFGERFLFIIATYCEEHSLHGNMEVKPPKRERKEKSTVEKTHTKVVSYSMYKEGKTVQEIAAARSITEATVLGHLSNRVSSGEIDINELVSEKKQITIKQAFEKYGTESLKPVVENNAGITYGDARMVLASMTAPLKQG